MNSLLTFAYVSRDEDSAALTRVASCFLADVFRCAVAVLAQEVTEGQRASLFVSSGLNDVNMMRVRPFTWSMRHASSPRARVRRSRSASNSSTQRGSYEEICHWTMIV